VVGEGFESKTPPQVPLTVNVDTDAYHHRCDRQSQRGAFVRCRHLNLRPTSHNVFKVLYQPWVHAQSWVDADLSHARRGTRQVGTVPLLGDFHRGNSLHDV